ncbi:MAG: HypC/HybG/HupF family hydrogenase formation chaperone [Thiohalocapsa sp.]
MCLAIPAQILEIDQTTDTATVSLGGVRKPVSLALVEHVAIGDYVLIHVGYALNRISPEEAERTLALIQQMGELDPIEFGPESESDSGNGREIQS